MAGKRRVRFTAKKKKGETKLAALTQPLPDPSFCNLPLPPLHINNDAALALLPWLAKGFAPVKASGKGDLCGINALWRAFREAREALQDPDEKIKHISLTKFEEFLNGDKYNRMADEVVKVQSDLGFVADKEGFEDLLAQTSNLDITQIGILVELANEEAGTDFALGYVTEGWRCRLNSNTKEYDNCYVSRSTANLAGDLLGDTAQRPARPVIWLWNDSYNVKQEAWGQDSESLNHWEGFGHFDAKNVERYTRVKNWRIGNTLKQSLQQGVWMVTQDHIRSKKNELSVMKGTFVRDSTPDCVVPQGWRFVEAYNDMRGLVPMHILSDVQLDPVASSLLDVDGGSSMVVMVETESAPTLREKINTQVLVENSTNTSVLAKKGPDPLQDTKHNGERTKGSNHGKHDQLELRFFRAIPPTNKMGYATGESLAIGKFDFKQGDILLDSTGRRNGIPTVITANGNAGEAHFRRLQYIDSAWGLPGQVRGILVNDHNIQKVKCNEQGSITADSQYHYSLPLYRLTENYSATKAKSDTEFLKGEIVRGIGPAGDTGSYFVVLDFESKLGTVDFADLETFGHPGCTGQHDYPFGILLFEDIPSKLVDNPENPENPKASVEKSLPRERSPSVRGVALSTCGSIFVSSDFEIQEVSDAPKASAGWGECSPEGNTESNSQSLNWPVSSDIKSTNTSEKSNAKQKCNKRSQDHDSEEISKKKKSKTE